MRAGPLPPDCNYTRRQAGLDAGRANLIPGSTRIVGPVRSSPTAFEGMLVNTGRRETSLEVARPNLP